MHFAKLCLCDSCICLCDFFIGAFFRQETRNNFKYIMICLHLVIWCLCIKIRLHLGRDLWSNGQKSSKWTWASGGIGLNLENGSCFYAKVLKNTFLWIILKMQGSMDFFSGDLLLKQSQIFDPSYFDRALHNKIFQNKNRVADCTILWLCVKEKGQK